MTREMDDEGDDEGEPADESAFSSQPIKHHPHDTRTAASLGERDTQLAARGSDLGGPAEENSTFPRQHVDLRAATLG